MNRFAVCIVLFFMIVCSRVETQEVTHEHKKLRFFVLDYHSAATKDVIDIVEALGHEVVYWTISPYSTRIYKHANHPTEIIKHENWRSLNPQMCDEFYEKYKPFLSTFDGFIVTAFSSFALIFEKFNKPIIIINGVRYEIPFTDKPPLWECLNQVLIEGVKRNKIFLVANNKGDQRYLKYYTGLDSEFIPSLCEYTKAHYTGKKPIYVGHIARNNDLFVKLVEKKLKPLGLMTTIDNFDTWQELYDFKGIVHFPYQISMMALYEQYMANVPLFFPTKGYLYFLQQLRPQNILNEVSSFWLFGTIPPPTTPGDLNNMKDPNVIKFWIDSADFYDEENMPYIQYFDSLDHLMQLLKTVDTQAISRKMQEYNVKRKKMVYEKWKALLDKVEASLNRP